MYHVHHEAASVGSRNALLDHATVSCSMMHQVTVWTNSTAPDFVHPELSAGDYGVEALLAKADIGISISGGGIRASCLGYGWLRALNEVRQPRAALRLPRPQCRQHPL